MIHKPSTVRTFLQLYEVGKRVGQTPEIQPDKKSLWSHFEANELCKKVITKQHNVSNSPFPYSSCLFERVAASMEIITFLSVSPSCVKASKPATTCF